MQLSLLPMTHQYQIWPWLLHSVYLRQPLAQAVQVTLAVVVGWSVCAGHAQTLAVVRRLWKHCCGSSSLEAALTRMLH
jgi:hypothetical protein